MIEVISSSFITEESEDIVENLAGVLIGKYSPGNDSDDFKGIVALTLYRQLPILMKLIKGDFKGKKILDIGCGSIDSKYERGTAYGPWLCRALLELGAMPIGVDKNTNRSERFQNYQADLEEKRTGLLSFLPSGSVDIVNSAGLFTHEGINLKNMEDFLVPEIKRVGKTQGFFVHDEPYLATGLSRLSYRLQPKPYALSGRPLHFLNSP